MRPVQALAQQIDAKQPRPQITVPHTTGESLARVIDYLYTDEVAFTPDNVVEVYAAAGALNLTRLQQLATVFIRDNVTVDNVLPMLQAANRLKAADVEKFLFKFFQNKERYGDRPGLSRLSVRPQWITQPTATAPPRVLGTAGTMTSFASRRSAKSLWTTSVRVSTTQCVGCLGSPRD